MHVCACVMCVCMQHTQATGQCQTPSSITLYFSFETGSVTELELTDSQLRVSPVPKLASGLQVYALMCLAFPWALGSELRPLCFIYQGSVFHPT